MPMSPPKMCNKCRRTYSGARCPDCRKPWAGSRRSGKTTRAYQRYRDNHLDENPMCSWDGCRAVGQVADHIVGISEGGDMFGPLRTLCHAHHDAVTQAQARRGRGLDP